jgi:hypothetical protein
MWPFTSNEDHILDIERDNKLYKEADRIRGQEQERARLQIRGRERERTQLLEEISHLEGKMSATTKVDQSQVYDLLAIVRRIVENQ